MNRITKISSKMTIIDPTIINDMFVVDNITYSVHLFNVAPF